MGLHAPAASHRGVVLADGVLYIHHVQRGRHAAAGLLLCQRLDSHQRVDGLAAIDDRPLALGPLYRSKAGLTAQVVIAAPEVAVSQECDPPGTVSGLHKVAMAGALNLRVLSCHAAVGEDGVGGVGLVRTIDVTAAGYGELMGQLGATLRDEQVVPAVLLVDMRSLRMTAAGATPQLPALGELLARLGVDLAQPDGCAGVADHVALAVLEVQRGVDTLLLEPDRLAPGTCGIGGGDHEVAAIGHIGGNHIEGTLVIADGGGIDAQPRVGTLQGQLALAVEHVAYEFPVDQVLGVVDGHTGEIMERRLHHIEVVAHTAYRRVRVKAGDDGIAQLLCRQRLCTKDEEKGNQELFHSFLRLTMQR